VKNSTFKKNLLESIYLKNNIITLESSINIATKEIFKKISSGGKVFLCGNGGSAADAQHLAAEFLVRLRPNINRKPIPAINLCGDTSTLTACSNDYSFNDIFSRNLEALATKNDILIAISTSGKSKNILNVLKTAKRKKIKSIGFFSIKKKNKIADIEINVPSTNVARIQETHIFIGHTIFEMVEDLIIKNK
jgi:D-sedoheptulose 7-phosphate isomerase